MSLEANIEVLITAVETLTTAIEDLTAAAPAGKPAATKPASRTRPASRPKAEEEEDEQGTTKPPARRKKAAVKKRKKAAKRPEAEEDEFMTVEELNQQIAPLAEEMGDQVTHISEMMKKKFGISKLSECPPDERQDLFDAVYKIHEEVMAASEGEEDDAANWDD